MSGGCTPFVALIDGLASVGFLRRVSSTAFWVAMSTMVAAVWLGFPSIAHAQSLLKLGAPGATNGGSAELIADEVVCTESACVFDGHVQLNSDSQVLFADKLIVEMGERDGERVPKGGMAEGNVLVIDGNVVTVCDRVHLNDDMVTGSLSLAEIVVKRAPKEKVPHSWEALKGRNALTMSGKIDRTGPTSFHIRDVYFTPCDCTDGRPTYSITAQEAWVELGSHANFYKPRLKPLDVALPGLPFALPFLHVPIAKRKTGVLPPGFRFSQQEAFYFEGGFFWATTPSVDMTFNLGLSELRGLRAAYELRYAVSPTFNGQWNVQWLHDDRFDAARKAEGKRGWLGAERFSLKFDHGSDLRGRNPVRLQGSLVSDGHYVLDQGFGIAAQQTPYLPTRLAYDHREDEWRFSLGASLYQDFAATRDLSSTVAGRGLQRLPELGLFVAPQRLPFGFYVSLQARSAALLRPMRERGQSFVADLDPTGLPLSTGRVGLCARGDNSCELRRFAGRAELLPKLSRPLFFGPLQVVPEVSSLLSVSGDSVMERAVPLLMFAGKVDATVTLGRVFRTESGSQHRHRVLPTARWLLIPEVFREANAVPVDERDLVLPTHQLALGVESDWFYKPTAAAAARRLVWVSVLQHFNLGGTSKMAKAALSELVLRARLTPWTGISFSGGGSYNWQEQRMREMNADLTLSQVGVGELRVGYQRIVGGGSARLNTGAFELSPGGAISLSTNGRFHQAFARVITDRVLWFKASYEVSMNLALNPRERTFALQHNVGFQYDSPCDCFGVQVNALLPNDVFEMRGTGRDAIRVTPTFFVYLTIGDTRLGVN